MSEETLQVIQYGSHIMAGAFIPGSCLCGVKARSALQNKVCLLPILPAPGKLDDVCLQATTSLICTLASHAIQCYTS